MTVADLKKLSLGFVIDFCVVKTQMKNDKYKSNEEKYNPDEAAEYLKELAEQKHIECDIVAYTYQNYATALCYIDGKSINQNLVDAGFADNIAL